MLGKFTSMKATLGMMFYTCQTRLGYLDAHPRGFRRRDGLTTTARQLPFSTSWGRCPATTGRRRFPPLSPSMYLDPSDRLFSPFTRASLLWSPGSKVLLSPHSFCESLSDPHPDLGRRNDPAYVCLASSIQEKKPIRCPSFSFSLSPAFRLFFFAVVQPCYGRLVCPFSHFR